MGAGRRILNLFRSEKVSAEIEREMSFHVEERADELMARGLPRPEAMRIARRQFGNVVYQKERTRDANMVTWLETLWTDTRYAIRALIAGPVFALIAILSLALGIGANTAIFTLINSVMLKSLPVRHPEELLLVTYGPEADAATVFTNPLWEAFRDRQDAFDGLFAYSDNSFNIAEAGEERMINGDYVSGSFFDVLGVRPALGRLLTKADDYRGCAGAAVLGYGLWQSAYGGDPGVTSRTISLDGHRFPIVGVADRSFFGMDVGANAQVYVPICAEEIRNPGSKNLDARSMWWLRIAGRPRAGADAAAVHARLVALAPSVYQATIPQNWSPDGKADYAKRTFGVRPAATGTSYLRRQYSSALIALMVIVGLVLLIACANVANLLLARATVRQREVAVRLAIGAGRGRLVRQLLTESLLLSAIGAALGVLFAQWGTRLLVGFLSSAGNTVWLDLSLDKRVLAFTIGVATLTGVLFGLAPAWRSAHVQPQSVMKANSRSVVEGHSRFSLGKALVVAQIALSLILVMGAALLVGSFRTLATKDVGFEKEVLLATLDVSGSNPAPERQRVFYADLLRRVRALPGVRDASMLRIVPLAGSSWNDQVVVDGQPAKSLEESLSWTNQVSDGFFATYGTPLVAGRDFNSSDLPGAPKVAIVNEAFATHYFGTTDVLGKTYNVIGPGTTKTPMRIVGVVKNTIYGDLKVPKPEPIAYQAMSQDEAPGARFKFAIRPVSGEAMALIPAFKNMAETFDPGSSLRFETMERVVADALTRERLLATLSGFFGGLALLLAMIGLYGIMSYNVARRRGEIGIRMALGSGRSSVMTMVLREVSGLVVAGVLIGGIGVFAGGKLIASFLFELQPTDARMLALSALTLGAVAIGAGALPAWRAGRVDPMEALREE